MENFLRCDSCFSPSLSLSTLLLAFPAHSVLRTAFFIFLIFCFYIFLFFFSPLPKNYATAILYIYVCMYLCMLLRGKAFVAYLTAAKGSQPTTFAYLQPVWRSKFMLALRFVCFLIACRILHTAYCMLHAACHCCGILLDAAHMINDYPGSSIPLPRVVCC